MFCGCEDIVKCFEPSTCPPFVAVLGATTSKTLDGYLPAFTKADLICAYGDEIGELNGEGCGQPLDPLCDGATHSVNTAMAQVYAALSATYCIPFQIATGPLFPSANVTEVSLIVGSQQWIVYYQLKDLVLSIARFLMRKDSLRLEEVKPAFYLKYESSLKFLESPVIFGALKCGATANKANSIVVTRKLVTDDLTQSRRGICC